MGKHSFEGGGGGGKNDIPQNHQDMVDKLCTAVWNKDVASITLLANKATINSAGVVKRNQQFHRLGEGLEYGSRVDPPIRLAADRPPATPLHYAAAGGDVGIIDLLLSMGADKTYECSLDMLPYEIAAANNLHKSIIRRLKPRYCWCCCLNKTRKRIPQKQDVKIELTLEDP